MKFLTKLSCSLTLLAASPSYAVPYTHGVGIAGKYGYGLGMMSGGAEISGRMDKFELAVGVMNGSADISDSVQSYFIFNTSGGQVDTATIDQHAVTALLKLHPMNGSFYIGMGGAFTQAKARLRASSTSNTGDYLNENMSVDRSLATVSIGNIWTPGGVIIGCEWVARHFKLSAKESTTSSSSDTSGSSTTEMKDKFYRRVRRDSSGDNISTLVLHIGYMFGS